MYPTKFIKSPFSSFTLLVQFPYRRVCPEARTAPFGIISVIIKLPEKLGYAPFSHPPKMKLEVLLVELGDNWFEMSAIALSDSALAAWATSSWLIAWVRLNFACPSWLEAWLSYSLTSLTFWFAFFSYPKVLLRVYYLVCKSDSEILFCKLAVYLAFCVLLASKLQFVSKFW